MAHNGAVGVRSLDSLLRDAARRHPRRPALAWGTLTRTYAELDHRCDGLASALVDGGLRARDRVGVLGRNRPECIEAMFAVWRAGGIVVPLNARVLVEEVVELLNDARTSAVVVGPEHASYVPVLAKRVPSLRMAAHRRPGPARRRRLRVHQGPVQGFVRGRPADYKRPKSVDFVEGLPRNGYGKVLKREVRSACWPHEDRRV